MKKYIIILLFCCAFSSLKAQVIPTSSTVPAAATTINPVPTAYSGTMKVNFVRTWDAKTAYTSEDSVVSASRTAREAIQTTQYFDGLGRNIQNVKKGQSATGKDIVEPIIYDDFGRDVFKYLPYVSIDSNNSNGKFRLNPFNEQASFYSNSTYNPGFSGEHIFYSKRVFDHSPLNRVDTSFAPGNSWGGSHIGVVTKFGINALSDSVRIWTIDMAYGSTPSSVGYYSAGELSKSIIIDDHGKHTLEYKDKLGKLILKKSQLDVSPSTHHAGWLCTYFIYDDLDNLRCVIQPKGVEARTPNWQLSTTVLNELCFRYEYDARGRATIKRVPGAGEAWMVYDSQDRLVMTQDSALRALGKWLYTKYDALNRPILTGLWENNYDRVYHQGQATSSSNYPSPSSGYEILSEIYYDNYSWVSGSGSGLSDVFINTYATNSNYFLTASNSTFPYPQEITPSYLTTSAVTGTKTRVLGTNNFLYLVTFYDEFGRAIQTHSTNQSGGKDTVTMQYSFSGQLLRSLICHQKAGINARIYRVLTKNDYDDAGRLTAVRKKTGSSAETVILENTYNELGQVKIKRIGKVRDENDPDSYTENSLDSIKYEYNIRGWLRGINKDFARGVTSVGWFGTELAYDFGFSQVQLNGNIAGIRWRSKGDGEQRAYGFTYDAVSRFSRADFTQYTGSTWNTDAGVDFTVKDMNYDPNGNILSMTQKGYKLTGSSVIDSLVYGYNSSSNRLAYITDKVNDSNSKLGDFKENSNDASQDYWYDGNGNLTEDNNKRITSITYNHLNLPIEIKMIGKGKIVYGYDADGRKLSKTTIDSTLSPVRTIETSYIGSFVYQNDTLQFAKTEEGKLRPQNANSSDTVFYDYFEKDHLGNVRVMLTDELKSDMYPPASFETGALADERLLYSKVDSGRVQINTIPDYPTDEYTDPNDYAQAVEGDAMRIGTGIVLKVMSGDKCDIRVTSFYPEDDYPYETPINPLSNLVTAFSGTVNSMPGHHPSGSELQSSGLLTSGITSFLNTQSSYDDQRPKAFVNWILFDEQFKFVSGGSGFEQVGDKGDFTFHVPKATINKNGYLYVYVSNESPDIPVYFDNLQVTHIRGPLLEENHYYPFGLTMAAISSKAYANQKNSYLFNTGTELGNKEFNDGSGLELYETTFRGYDPQIGRFWQLDPLSDKYKSWSLYCFASDNPISFSDPLGLEPEDDKKPKETSTAEKPKLLEGVTVKGTRYKNVYLTLMMRTPSMAQNIARIAPMKDIARLTGTELHKIFTDYLNKHPEYFRYVAAKYVDMRMLQHGNRIIAMGQMYWITMSYLDYTLRTNAGLVSPIPDLSGITSWIAKETSADFDESIITQTLTLVSRGERDVAGLGRVFKSCASRGHGVPLWGTYVSSSELMTIMVNGGTVDPSKLMYKTYNFTDTYPQKEGVHYNHFILYKDNVLIPVVEKPLQRW